ncbi:FtsX-like permease family protein [Embleya sp. AB8]|uniref:FtsX-like permease family protein n=1 Tax=Embleya sp. AB8 TaxID=3156304 RepID=UPI003C78E32B
MSAVRAIAWRAITRRRPQTVVILVVALLSTATAVLGLGLSAASHGPFDRAFARLHGAHAAVTTDPDRAGDERLRATEALGRVAAFAGPFPQVRIVTREANGHGAVFAVVGRADPGGPVDRVVVNSGRWVRASGEIVLTQTSGHTLGDVLNVGGTRLTIVGFAGSVTETARGWVTPEQALGFGPDADPPTRQVLYRFKGGSSDAQVRDDVAEVTRALPPGTVLAAPSYLRARDRAAGDSALFVPFVLAFAALGLAMSVLIVSNVVGAAVVAGFRTIGIHRTLGFTPAQVCAVYVAQAVLPALVGALVGLGAGHELASALLPSADRAFGVPSTSRVPLWVDAAAFVGTMAVVGVAAFLPALRAARLSAITAMGTGRAPRAGHGYRVGRWLGRTRLPRPASLGLAGSFARPARTALTLGAVLVGAVSVTFAVGLGSTLSRAEHALNRADAVPVTVDLRQDAGGGKSPVRGGTIDKSGAGIPPVDPAPVAAALRADPGTRRFAALTRVSAAVPGRAEGVDVDAYAGDASWVGYPVVSGRWFRSPGEAVLPHALLRSTGTSVGGTLALDVGGRRIAVRVVGEVFADRENTVLTDVGTLGEVRPAPATTMFEVQVTSGTDPGAYARHLNTNRALGLAPHSASTTARSDDVVVVMLSLVATFTVLLAVVAALGVLNTVVLDTRERAHSIGVLRTVGMTPRQTAAMVLTSMAGVGVVGGVLGIPAGVALHHAVAPAMARTADLRLPDSMIAVYDVPWYAGLLAASVALTVLGAAAPAIWAARARFATVLRAE